MNSRLEWMRANEPELMATLRDIEVSKIRRRHGSRAAQEAGSRPLKRTIIESLGVIALTQASAPESGDALASPLNICRNGDYCAQRTLYDESVGKVLSVETGAHDDPAGVLMTSLAWASLPTTSRPQSSRQGSRPRTLQGRQRKAATQSKISPGVRFLVGSIKQNQASRLKPDSLSRESARDGAVSSSLWGESRPFAAPKDRGEGPAQCFKPARRPRHHVAADGGRSEPSECEADRLSSTCTVASTSPEGPLAQAPRCTCDYRKSAMALLTLLALPVLWCSILGPWSEN